MTAARILVIDDEERIRELLCDFLRLSGYEVEVTSDGALDSKSVPALNCTARREK